MRVTIKDVAKESGFSITTVSFVLNNKGSNIPEKTRNHIVEVAQRLGYRPNQLAVSMITGKSNILGLIIPDNSNLFFSEMSKSIEMEAVKNGYSLIYGNTNNEKMRDFSYLKLFVDRQVDGIILARSSSLTSTEEHENLQFLRDQGVPYVVVDRISHGATGYMICVDNVMGGYLAAKHLLSLGHRRIGCFTGPLHLVNSLDRLAGVKKAFQEYKLTYDDSLTFEGNYQLGSEEEALFFFLKHDVSAIFSFNDLMAYGLYRAALKTGVHIPDDISVIGYDNVSFSDIVYPGLTTIAQPIQEIAAMAVSHIISLIGDPSLSESKREELLKPELIVRGSTKPV